MGNVQSGQSQTPTGPTYPDVQGAPAPFAANTAPNQSASQQSQEKLPPPPPPPIFNPYTQGGSGVRQNYTQTPPDSTYTPPPLVTPPQTGGYQVPAYAQKPRNNRGCAIGSVILLLVLVLGIGGFLLLRSFINRSISADTGPGATSTSSTGTTPDTSATPTAATHVSSSEQLNLQLTYASVNITLISAQLAPSFSDDTSTTSGSTGIVRINLRENNTKANNPDYTEHASMLLVLPGGNTSELGNEQSGISPDAGVNRTNWLDFPLNSPSALNQLILRIGTPTQSQFDIPLQPGANISKYQDKTNNLNTPFNYGGLNMILKSATLSYSYNVTQATTGNRYLIITLSAVNNTSNGVSLSPGNYMRLQAGGNSVAPDGTTTLPYEVAANTSNAGVVAFLVPQNASNFTLVLLAQASSPPINQVTQAFQVQ